MTNLRNFVLTLALLFGLPWLLLIVVPALKAQKLAPLAYDKDRDGVEGIYPGNGIYRQGQLVYSREGCVQCHTQMIRPAFSGMMDGWKKGWGSDMSDIPREPTRSSTARDYIGEPVAPLGVQRNGPDLANLGYRVKDKAELHLQLYAPRAKDKWSIMPAFRHLYKTQLIQGNGSPDALKLEGQQSPAPGYEVVPTEDAVQLVEYLVSLKKDAPVPGQVSAEAKK
jgi:cytochrome c oxidase cbb3-type subunit II